MKKVAICVLSVILIACLQVSCRFIGEDFGWEVRINVENKSPDSIWIRLSYEDEEAGEYYLDNLKSISDIRAVDDENGLLKLVTPHESSYVYCYYDYLLSENVDAYVWVYKRSTLEKYGNLYDLILSHECDRKYVIARDQIKDFRKRIVYSDRQ